MNKKSEQVRQNKIGERYVGWFKELCGLKPNENVLDVGCRDGKMALPLTKYLKGRYEGFDIGKKEIKFCKKKITSKYSNFNFQVIDLYNGMYNPKGKLKSFELRFPYKDKSFDFIFLTSVFTHMLPEEVKHYVSEIVRVLKDDGRCLLTFFLMNDETRELISKRDPKLLVSKGSHKPNEVLNFKNCGKFSTINKKMPENAVAYEEKIMGLMLKNNGLKIDKICYGYWCGRKQNFLSYQDIVIAKKL